jgi:hypothetical protein
MKDMIAASIAPATIPAPEGTEERRIMPTLTVEVTIDQLLETIKLLPAGEQVQLFDALEDYFLGKHIEATVGEPLLSREEAMHYLAEAG